MRYDVIVLGGGTAGLTAALAARHAGASVALVEREPRIGGDCSFWGCVPSKTLVELAGVVHRARRAATAGIIEEPSPVKFAAVMARVRAVVDEIATDERDERFEQAGIDVVHGVGSFDGPTTLTVDGTVLQAGRIVLATGSETVLPALPGLESVPFLTNRTVFELVQLPRRLLVLGGGGTGLELAQVFRRLGAEVTVIEREERLLTADDPRAGAVARAVLEAERVEVLLGATALSVAAGDAGIRLELEGGAVMTGDALLVATARRAALDGLGLERAGIAVEDGFVRADRRCRTSAGDVFAAGDVTGGAQFTHVAAHEGLVAGLNAAGKRRRVDERVVPRVTYLDPEIGSVGLTEAEARRTRRGVVVVESAMSDADRARIEGRELGYVRLVTARRRLLGRLGGGVLVGAHVAGPRAGELLAECALAIQTRSFAGRLAQTMHAYPTLGVAVQETAARLTRLGRALVE